MYYTPQDLYYAVAAISVAVLTTLLSMALIRLLGILKRVDNVTAVVEEGVAAVEEGIEEVKDRVSSLANYGKIATKLAESAITLYQNRVSDDCEDEDTQKSGRKRRIR